jgi:glycosyltransferase involved in cell wall biosynthesis
VELLAVASLTPRKGYDVLFQALATLTHFSWHLTCAGTGDLHPPTAEALSRQVRESGLADRVTFVGELKDEPLAIVYDRADVFVLPTRHEGYGMAVAEAVARGIPVIGTPTGAIPDLVDDTSGVIVPIDDVSALAIALERVMNDEARARLADGAARRRATLPTWEDAVGLMADALTVFSVNAVLQR